MADDSYVPKSPDLSAFFSAPAPTSPTPPPQNPYHPRHSHSHSFQSLPPQQNPQNQQHPNLGLQTTGPSYEHQPLHASSYAYPASASAAIKREVFPSSGIEHHPYSAYPGGHGQHFSQGYQQPHPSQNIPPALPRHFPYNPQPNAVFQHPPPPHAQTQSQPLPLQEPQLAGAAPYNSHTRSHSHSHSRSSSHSQSQYSYHAPNIHQQPPEAAPETMPPRKAAQPAQPPPAIEPSPVKTKFPTARIKRIMQADEEVGKVAQQTPIAVGKALELFMIHVVSKSAEIAKERNSKRVTAQMLKQVIETDGQYDFLADIAAKVADDDKKGSRGGASVKADTESEEEFEAEPKKRTRGAGRKRKAGT